MLGQGPPAIDEAERPAVGVVRTLGPAGIHELLALHPVDDRPPADGREGQPHRTLGQPIDRRQRLAVEPEIPEPVGEPLQGIGVDGFGAVNGQTPGTQVQALDVLVGDPVEAQFIGEIGRRRDRPPGPVDRPQPTFRTGQEIQRRHDDQGAGVIEGAEPRPDQAHVVIKGQPTDERVPGGGLQRLAHGPDVGHQVGVGQRHPFGRPGAARGVLQKGDVPVPQRRPA